MRSFILVFCLFALPQLISAQENTQVGPAVGQSAPEVEGEDPDGKVYRLSSLKGYLVLLDFWASWCGPCRHENPTVVKAYETYSKLKLNNAKGFKVFSVSLDKNRDAWKLAILQDHLDWKYHISELKAWDASAVKDYRVSAIPSNFLISPDGQVIAVNLRGDALLIELEKWVKY